jgi:RecB family endonuclease NucS
MIFQVREPDCSMKAYTASHWNPKELELERYLLSGDEHLLDESVFREPLLVKSNQVRTRDSKRADILSLDQAGAGVVIELKRDQGNRGVETQALQYLASFSVFKGRDFIAHFAKGRGRRIGF